MSAKEHLSPQLFHGTNAVLFEGDIIKPGYHNEIGVGAYATDNADFAGLHPASAARRGKTDETSEGSSPQLFGMVYEVEPLSPPEEILHLQGLVGNEMADPKGLKVRKLHGYYNAY